MQGWTELSHSELRGLILKAARGAGLPWGLAEEAGWAAEWLSRRSLPAADWAAEWLPGVGPGRINPVETGTRIADASGPVGKPSSQFQLPKDLPAPGFLLPFLHLVARRTGKSVELVGQSGAAAIVAVDGTVRFAPAWPDHRPDMSLPPTQAAPRPRLRPEVLHCLEALALQTTVPPSEVSRQRAGSATPDSD